MFEFAIYVMYIFLTCQISINLIFTRIELGTYQKPHGFYLIYIFTIIKIYLDASSNVFQIHFQLSTMHNEKYKKCG